jgi:hypothetical protein
MHELDGLLDTSEPYPERSRRYDEMIDIIVGESQHVCESCYACQLQAHLTAGSEQQRSIFKANTNHIKILGEKKRTSTKVRELGLMSANEGQAAAELLELPETTPATTAFNSWLGNLGIFGTLIDTAIDLPSDYESGLTSVPPLTRNRLVLAGMGLPYAGRVARHFSLPLARSFTKALVAVGDDRNKDMVRQAI